jgi:VWFA-related protein
VPGFATPFSNELTMLFRALSLSRVASLACVILLGSVMFANQLNQKDKPFSLRVPVEMVIVPVTVEEGDGTLVTGLQKEDFELLEEGVPQTILYFSSDPVPLSTAVLIDRSTSADTQFTLKETLLSLVESFSPFDEIAVFQFEHTTDKVQDFTSNKEEILKSLQRMSLVGTPPGFSGGPLGGSGGQFSGETTISGIPVETARGKVPPPKTLNTHIHDAVFVASQELRRRDRSRRANIMLISNGQNAPGNRHSFDETMEALQNRDITVFAIAQGSSLLFRKSNVLSKYANPTGGAVFYPVKNNGFSETYARISQMARNQYVLGYLPNQGVESVTFRKIDVRLRNNTIKFDKIRNRNGYYAVPH